MVTKAGERRAEREKQSRIRNGIATAGAVVITLLVTVIPRTGAWICADLSLSLLISLYCVWHSWGLRPTASKRFGFLVLHVGVLFGIGYLVWPRIVVSPSHVSFAGYPNETFNFSVRNEGSEDVYDVQIPFPIGKDKHFEDKLSAKVFPNGDPIPGITNDFDYCYGEGSDVKNIRPHEQEVFIVRIRHLAPQAIGNFSITYRGGGKFGTKAGAADFLSEPFSYSSTQGVVGVRGNFRICKISMHADQPEDTHGG